MELNDMLEKILTVPMEKNLRNELLKFLFLNTGNKTAGIPRLKDCQSTLNCDEIFARMKTAAGGTGVSVAKILGISAQGFNNQLNRKAISGNSIIDFHLKTGISVDWLIGSWAGNTSDYILTSISGDAKVAIETEHPKQKYLSLVEIYDQNTGNAELKWCLTKQYICLDDDNLPLSGDFSALLSIITRYKNEAGTPDRVKNGTKHHFQVRRVLAYVLGDPKIIRQIDARAKLLSAKHISAFIERPGKTEFRLFSSKDECLNLFAMVAEQCGVSISRPVFDTIAWDYLIGAGSMSPQDWVVNKYNDFKKQQKQETLTPEELVAAHILPESMPHSVSFASTFTV
jgi:hypothetical protein